jgi:hypothetical protein
LAGLGGNDPGDRRFFSGGHLYDALDIKIIPDVGKIIAGPGYQAEFLIKH